MKGKGNPFGVGIATILTVLLVLCLTVFSALALSSARADLALSRTGADTIAAYYAADAKAAALYQQFEKSRAAELKEEIPVTEHQVLSIHLRRKAGKIEIAKWQTAITDEPQQEQHLNVWTNESEGTP